MPRFPRRFLCAFLGILIFHTNAYGESSAQEIANKEPQYAITWNPLFSTLSQSLLRNVEEEADLINIGVADFSLRFQNRLASKIGILIQADYTQLSLFTQTTYVGVRGGPRYFFRPTGLGGWSATPFILIGRSVVAAGAYGLASWTVCGLGAEMDYTWSWGPVLLEIGLGGYTAYNIGYTAHADTLNETSAPPTISQWKPLLTMGIGYAF